MAGRARARPTAAARPAAVRRTEAPPRRAPEAAVVSVGALGATGLLENAHQQAEAEEGKTRMFAADV